jgi:hypothetical protein
MTPPCRRYQRPKQQRPLTRGLFRAFWSRDKTDKRSGFFRKDQPGKPSPFVNANPFHAPDAMRATAWPAHSNASVDGWGSPTAAVSGRSSRSALSSLSRARSSLLSCSLLVGGHLNAACFSSIHYSCRAPTISFRSRSRLTKSPDQDPKCSEDIHPPTFAAIL